MTTDEAFDRLLELAGSDLLFSCGSKPRIRKDGNLEPMDADSKVLIPADTQRMAREILDAKQLKELEKRKHVDFSFTWRDRARIRGNAYHQRTRSPSRSGSCRSRFRASICSASLNPSTGCSRGSTA